MVMVEGKMILWNFISKEIQDPLCVHQVLAAIEPDDNVSICLAATDRTKT